MLIVYVDSDNASREANAQRLESNGYRVLQAATGPFGIDLCQEFSPDLIITTQHPIDAEVDGPDYVRSLQEVAPNTPIVVMADTHKRRPQPLVNPPAFCLLLARPVSFTDLSFAIRSLEGEAHLPAETA